MPKVGGAPAETPIIVARENRYIWVYVLKGVTTGWLSYCRTKCKCSYNSIQLHRV